MNTLAGETSGAGARSWQELMDDPVGWIDPSRLSECLGGDLPEELCAQLAGNPRLKSRLSAIVAGQHALPPLSGNVQCGDADRAIVLATAAALHQIALFAGAIYWAAAIANTVRASDVAALRDQIGEELSAFALKNRDLAGPEKSIGSFGDIADRIVESGWHCLAAWRDSLDPAIGARINLKLPSNAFPSAPNLAYADLGPAIVRRASAKVV
jgi:hypothetical protein